MRAKKWIIGICVLTSLVCYGPAVLGYPERPVRLIVPFPPGSGIDIIARLVSQKLTEKWKQSVVVDNRPGATGNIGVALAARATPDGYTMLFGNIATHGTNPSLYKEIPYDAVRDFVPVILLAQAPALIAIHPMVPAQSMKEFIALAKAKPGELRYGSGGSGSGSHMAAELLEYIAGIKLIHVPYKGSGQSLTATISGEVHAVFTGVLSAVPHVQSGRLRALAVSSTKRIAALPNVPTLVEAGLPEFQITYWYGVFFPKGTAKQMVNKLNKDINEILSQPDVAELLGTDGAEIGGGTPEEFAAFIQKELKKWAKVVAAQNIRVQ